MHDMDEDGPEPTYEEWVAANIGPRKVGGRYRSGYDGGEYTVTAIDPGPREGWPVWQITVLHDGSDYPVSHCTAWDPQRDQVLSEPDAAQPTVWILTKGTDIDTAIGGVFADRELGRAEFDAQAVALHESWRCDCGEQIEDWAAPVEHRVEVDEGEDGSARTAYRGDWLALQPHVVVQAAADGSAAR